MTAEQRVSIDVVDFEFRRIPEIKIMQEAFELRPECGYVWLQKCCLWVLRKLGCFAHFETVRVDRHYIGRKGSTFMEKLWARRNLIYGSFDQKPTRLLIGSTDYARLMDEEYSRSAFSFNSEYYVGNGAGQRPTVMGLKIEVIPWMEGMLLL